MCSLPTVTITIIVLAFFGVLGDEKQSNGAPIETNEDQYSKASNGDEVFSDGSDLSPASQNSFYPSYSPFQNQPLGHSRPFYFNQQEAAYSQRPYLNSFDSAARFSGYKDFSPPAKTDQLGLLGSGNFGVIPGGTFYQENDENNGYGDYDSLYHNGHGRPSTYYAASNPKPYTQEQFANFRDFADINTPNDRQYSQYVVVYAPNKNKSEEEDDKGKEKTPVPKNIIESLTLLDLQTPTTTETVPEKKLSKSKRKLALLPVEKKYLKKSLNKLKAKDMEEPLMALS